MVQKESKGREKEKRGLVLDRRDTARERERVNPTI